MPYGIIKVDTITFTDGGADKTVSISGLVQNPTFSGNITVTGTISGNVIRGGTTVSGATVTGTAGQFGTLTGNTAGFTTITGATVTGTVAQFTTITGGTAGFTTVTGATVTGTTANFTTLSGTTVTGNTGSFTTVTGGVATITSGVFAVGAEALPSISFASDPNTGIYSPGADQVAISTGGSGRLFVDASGRVGVGTSSPTSSLHVEGNALLNGASKSLQIGSSGANWLYFAATSGGSELSHNNNAFQLITSQTNGITFSTNGANERLRITSAGLVGVGTSSVSSKLHIQDAHTLTADSQIALIENTTTGEPASLAFLAKADNGGAGNKGAIYFDAGANGATADNKLQFTAQHQDTITPAMTLDGSGRLGIGTQSPNVALTINGGAVSTGALIPTSDIAFPSAYGNGFFRAVGNYNQGAGTGGTIQLGGKSYTDSGFVGAFLISAVSGGNATDALTFSTQTSFNNVVSERMRLDSSGRLLVGTSSATNNIRLDQKLAVVSNSNYAGLSLTSYAGSSFAVRPVLDFQKSRGAADGTMTIVNNDDYLGTIVFRGSDGSAFQDAAYIDARVEGTPAAGKIASRLVFSTTADGASSPTERMRIDNTGNVVLKPTDPVSVTNAYSTYLGFRVTQTNAQSALLGTIRGQGASSWGGDLVFSTKPSNGNPDDSVTERMRITSHGEIRITQSATGLTVINTGANGTALIYFQTASAELGKIRINGAGVAYDTTSDYRLKENIEPITDAVSRLQALKPWRFNFISHPDVTVDGFLAHEAQEVVPEAVGGHKDEEDADGNPIYQGIDQSKLVPLLTAALQEAIGRIEALEAEVAALKAS